MCCLTTTADIQFSFRKKMSVFLTLNVFKRISQLKQYHFLNTTRPLPDLNGKKNRFNTTPSICMKIYILYFEIKIVALLLKAGV